MLKEYPSIRQIDSEYRRLFRDDNFELYVFYEHKDAEMSGFQLIQNESSSAHVLVWDRARGLHYYRMEDGDGDILNRESVLIPAARTDTRDMVDDFRKAAIGIDKDVFDYVSAFLCQ